MDKAYIDTCGHDPANIELEHIEYLIACGARVDEVLDMFPQYKKEIYNIVRKTAKFCWIDKDEWGLFRLCNIDSCVEQ